MNRHGKPCSKPAGHGTSHPGEGRCRNHGGVGQKPSQRYQDLQAPERLGKLLEAFSNDPDPLNLLPELALMRALAADHVERHGARTEALLAWHNSFSGAYLKGIEAWQGQVLILTLAGVLPADLPKAPHPDQYASKPMKLPDPIDAHRVLDRIGALVERAEKARKEGAISLAKLDAILEELSVQLVEASREREVGIDEVTRARLLAAVERRWGNIDTDNLPVAPGPAPSSEPRVTN